VYQRGFSTRDLLLRKELLETDFQGANSVLSRMAWVMTESPSSLDPCMDRVNRRLRPSFVAGVIMKLAGDKRNVTRVRIASPARRIYAGKIIALWPAMIGLPQSGGK
jgi:hypothetical protein